MALNRSNIMDTMKSFEQQLIDNKTEFADLKEELSKERKCSPKVCLLAEKLAKFHITIEEDEHELTIIKGLSRDFESVHHKRTYLAKCRDQLKNYIRDQIAEVHSLEKKLEISDMTATFDVVMYQLIEGTSPYKLNKAHVTSNPVLPSSQL